MNLVLAISIFFIFLVLGFLATRVMFMFDKHSHFNNQRFRSSDGYYYKVHGALENQEKAANVIMELNDRAIILITYLKKYYSNDYSKIVKNKTPSMFVKNLLERYNPDNIVESSPFNPEQDTSFTINKGKKLAICLRIKKGEKKGQFHDLNTLTFVLVHELTHLAVNVYGHPPEFWIGFEWMLRKAIEVGIYKPVNYRKNPVNYCGLEITSSPIF